MSWAGGREPYLTTATWTFLVALQMLRSPLFGRVLGGAGVVLALGIAAGLGEPAGWTTGATINTLSYLVWSVWLLVLGVTLQLRRAPGAAAAPVVASAVPA